MSISYYRSVMSYRMIVKTQLLSPGVFFFFQAEDGIRDVAVTGVQTCALPISGRQGRPLCRLPPPDGGDGLPGDPGEPRRARAAPPCGRREPLSVHFVLGLDGRDPGVRRRRRGAGALLPRRPRIPAAARAGGGALRGAGGLAALTRSSRAPRWAGAATAWGARPSLPPSA